MFTSQNPNPNARKTFVLFRPFVAVWHWLFPPSLAHRDRQSKSSRIIAGAAIIALCVGMVVAAIFYAKPIYNRYQSWQAERKIAKAKELEKQDRGLEAWRLADEAYALDSNNPGAIRTLARYYAAGGRKEAFYLLDKLQRLGVETDDDRLLRIQALVNNRETRDAQSQIEDLLKSSRPTARMVEIADQVMIQRGRTRELLNILQSYVASAPDDQEIGFALARRQVQFGTAEEKQQGIRALWELARSPEKPGLKALEVLVGVNSSDTEDQKQLVELLRNHPLAEESHRIAALSKQVAVDPANRNAIIDQAINDRKNARGKDLIPLAEWLAGENEFERLLAFCKKEWAQDYPPLLMPYLRALAETKRYDELVNIVDDPRTKLIPAERAIEKVLVAHAMKKSPEEVKKLLSQAITLAEGSGRPQYLLQTARWAEKNGFPASAEQAYRATVLSAGPASLQRNASEGLVRLTYSSGRSEEFVQAAREAAKRWPENEDFVELSLYASLLAGLEMESATAQIQKLLDANPDDNHRKLLMGLAQYRLLDARAALKYFNNINLSRLLPGQGAVLCGILFRAGGSEAEKGRALAQQIAPDTPMLPEEKKFLQEVRPDLAAASSATTPGQP